MSWIQRYKLQRYVAHSVWVLPVVGMVAALVAVRCMSWLDARLGWPSTVDPDAARTVLDALAGAMFTFIVFLSSTLLLVLQLASAQLSPRIIGLVFGNRMTRSVLALFAFTFTFTLAAVLRIGNTVPTILLHTTAYLCVLSLGAFLFFIDYLGKSLRPSGVLKSLARLGHDVIQSVYPRRFSGQLDTARRPANAPGGEPARTVKSSKDGVVLAFDLAGLVELARRADCVVELVPQVGDFIAVGSPLFRIFAGRGNPSEKALCQSVAMGQERTIEQDPAFAFRILVDIASKGLSPAINDPTTAVLAIDQIHHLLGSVGGRQLDEGLGLDRFGALRLVYPTPNWEDFVHLAVTEIRQFGGTSIQVVRRLRAMLEQLTKALPPERSALLRRELTLLHSTARRCFPEFEDQALADIGDLQGVGGKNSAANSVTEEPKSTTVGPESI